MFTKYHNSTIENSAYTIKHALKVQALGGYYSVLVTNYHQLESELIHDMKIEQFMVNFEKRNGIYTLKVGRKEYCFNEYREIISFISCHAIACYSDYIQEYYNNLTNED